MQFFEAKSVLIFFALSYGLFCSANEVEKLKKRIRLLETKLNAEVFFRDEEYAEITERLDDIDKVLNETTARGHSMGHTVISKTTEVSYPDVEDVEILKGDFERIKKAFRKEKTEAKRIRREIPKIESKLISIYADVENYCTNALNITEKLLTGFEVSSVQKTSILQNVAGKLETVSKNTENIIEASQHANQSIIHLTRKIEQFEHENQRILHFTRKIEQVEINTKVINDVSSKTKNIESLITDLHSKINFLFIGSSCLEFLKIKSGILYLQLGLKVYCDQETDGGGWTVFQRRINGEVDFYRNWTEYKNGFGDLNGEFWLGNEHLSLMTAHGDHELRVEMEDFDGNSAYAKYSKFKVYPEEDKYRLELSGYSGTAGDSLEYHNRMMFSTFDSDNDKWSSNCAIKYHSAWWYNLCHYSHLNGQYYNEPNKECSKGISWFYWKNMRYCLKRVEMKFR